MTCRFFIDLKCKSQILSGLLIAKQPFAFTRLERAFNNNTDIDLEEVSEDTLDVTKTNYTAKLAEEKQIELGTTL